MKNAMRGIHLLLGAMVCSVMMTGAGSAEPTRLAVSVFGKGSKFIGTSMGGAFVVVKDVRTGRILAEGKTEGTTGNTNKIMSAPRNGGVMSDENSARFIAAVDIDEPTYVEISAYGPLAQRQSANTIAITQWIFPGKHIIEGDGILLELPGFVVDVLSPPAHVRMGAAPQSVPIRANVTLMCGCPITPGGIWDANDYEIKAVIKRDGKQTGVLDLQYAGEPSQFSATYQAADPGAYEIIVYAFDSSTGNTGLDSTTFLVN